MVVDPPMADTEEFAVLGDQLLSNAVVTLDFVGKQITFTDESRFKYLGKSKPIPMRVEENCVKVEGEVDGVPGLFALDTSDVWSLELLSPFVKNHDLVRRYGAKFQGYAGRGYGGPGHAFYARVHTLRLGEVEVHDPLLFFTPTLREELLHHRMPETLASIYCGGSRLPSICSWRAIP